MSGFLPGPIVARQVPVGAEYLCVQCRVRCEVEEAFSSHGSVARFLGALPLPAGDFCAVVYAVWVSGAATDAIGRVQSLRFSRWCLALPGRSRLRFPWRALRRQRGACGLVSFRRALVISSSGT